MIYDFDTTIDRSKTNSSKWNVKYGVLPMWVADMDFRTCPKIIDAFRKRIDQGIYGYTDISDDWRNSIAGWWERCHGLTMDKSKLLFSTGVIPSLSSLVRKLTKPGDNIAVMTPVYDIFFHSIENNHRKTLECPLVYENGEYNLDFDLLDRILSTPNTPLLILCNPHNPIGRIWSEEELKKIHSIAKNHGVIVISDEIHCDLVRIGLKYTPYLKAIGDDRGNSIMLMSPTKAFNLAGIQTSSIYCEDPNLYELIHRSINDDEIAEPNILAQIATIAAYDESEDWLDQLRAYLDSNIKLVEKYIESNLPQIKICKAQGTYLMWLDVSNICEDSSELYEFLLSNAALRLSEGSEYRGNGNKFLRLNVACPRTMLVDGLDRLKLGIESFEIARSKTRK